MGFVCTKTLKLNGTVYNPGDAIPVGEILTTRVRALKVNGYIGEIENAVQVEKPASIPDEEPKAEETHTDDSTDKTVSVKETVESGKKKASTGSKKATDGAEKKADAE